MTRREKTARQIAIQKADNAFSLYIRKRDNYTCYTCGQTNAVATIQCGHLISRGKWGTRYDETNSKAQCRPCNLRHEHDPEIFTQKWIAGYGVDAYEELIRRSNGIIKYATGDLKELAEHYMKLARDG